MDNKVREAEKAIWFWTNEYDGCYPPLFHHPTTDMETVKRGWDYLLSLLSEKEKEINTLQQSINQYIDGVQVNLKERCERAEKVETYVKQLKEAFDRLTKDLMEAAGTYPHL